MKPIILFDIDHTLIDTDRLRKLIEDKNISLLKINKKDYQQLIRKFAGTLENSRQFCPEKYLDFLEEKLSKNFPRKKILRHYYRDEESYQTALFPEVLEVISRLKKNYRLGIFSEGSRPFQLAKINLSGIANFFDRELVFIYSDKYQKANCLVEKIGSFWLVDDNFRHLLAYERNRQIRKVFIRRGESKIGDKNGGNFEIETINSLGELLALLDNESRF